MAGRWKIRIKTTVCLSIILCVGLADNCTFIFTTKYTDTLSIMQRKFLILFMKFAKRGDLIHCTPDKTQKQSAGAERNFSGDTPWVINDNSSSQVRPEAQADLVIIFIVRFHICASNVLCMKNEPAACSLRVWYLSFLINYNKLFPQWTKMKSRIMKKERFSAQYLFVIMILLTEVEQ